MPELIHQFSELDINREYSYADYLLWRFKERVELIRGKIRKMSAPGTEHQQLSGNLFREFSVFLKGKPCKVFAAPFDVRLSPSVPLPDGKIYNVVQPDLCVICDLQKLDARGCLGAPDLVIEILSPGNNRKELRDKYELYESNGVQEYWVMMPTEQTLVIHTLQAGVYVPGRIFTKGDVVGSTVLPGFQLDLNEVFEELPFS
ncbi:MAG: Uma2 family endonuclease [Chitinophagales bacterium]|nr:Uma2 family endonuclease [Chitinophagales bacterium]